MDEETTQGPLFPEVEVQLTGEDGNSFYIMGRVAKAMKRARVPQESVDAFYAEATSGDYDHLLQTCMKYVNCR